MKTEQSLLQDLNATLLSVRMGSASHDHRGPKMHKAKADAYAFLKKHGKTIRLLVEREEKLAVSQWWEKLEEQESRHERS